METVTDRGDKWIWNILNEVEIKYEEFQKGASWFFKWLFEQLFKTASIALGSVWMETQRLQSIASKVFKWPF